MLIIIFVLNANPRCQGKTAWSARSCGVFSQLVSESWLLSISRIYKVSLKLSRWCKIDHKVLFYAMIVFDDFGVFRDTFAGLSLKILKKKYIFVFLGMNQNLKKP